MTSLWRHLWPNHDTLNFKILTQYVKMLGERVLQVWRWYLHRFRRYRKKTRGGLEIAPPPPSGARVKTGNQWQIRNDRITTEQNDNRSQNQPTNHRPLTTDHWPPITDHRPLTTDHWPLMTTDHWPQMTIDHRPLTTDHRPLTTDH